MAKVCKGPCGLEKSLDCFPVRKESIDGHRHVCKVCKNEQHKAWSSNRKVPEFKCDGLDITCVTCELIKPCDEFEVRSDSQKRRTDCRGCRKKQNEMWRLENTEYVQEKNKKYYEENKPKIIEQCKEYRETHREQIAESQLSYREAHREELSKRSVEYTKKRLEADQLYKLKRQLRCRVLNAIKAQYGEKAEKTMNLIGADSETVRKHLESQFKPGMMWENHGLKGWHIDHVFPCASFNLEDPEEQKKCFHWTNLQPLWAEENLKKSSKIL